MRDFSASPEQRSTGGESTRSAGVAAAPHERDLSRGGRGRPAFESATVVLWFRGRGSLAKSRSGTNGDGDCGRIFLAKPFLQSMGVFPVVGYYFAGGSHRCVPVLQRGSSLFVDWVSDSLCLWIRRGLNRALGV